MIDSVKTVDVDFNSLARNGKIKVWRADADSLDIGAVALLREEAEDMQMFARLVEIDGDWAYFELIAATQAQASVSGPAHIEQSSPSPWFGSLDKAAS